MNLNESTEGRWLTPDLLGGDITNPQSLNRYAYALNNPTTLTDPSGVGCHGLHAQQFGWGHLLRPGFRDGEWWHAAAFTTLSQRL